VHTLARRATASFLLAAAIACVGQAEPEPGPTTPIREAVPCTVTRIVDGDTLDCEPVGRVRLLGIDTPELAQEPFGNIATEALADLIPDDGRIRVERDVEDRDQHDRALRYVWVDSVLVNWALVRRGYAVLLTFPPNVQWAGAIQEAQDAAREEELGLWAVDGFACLPRAHRAGRCR
jgi:micrococcal nuclease